MPLGLVAKRFLGGFFSITLKDLFPQLAKRKLDPINKRSHRFQLLRQLLNEIRWGNGERDPLTGKKVITPVNFKARIIANRVHHDGYLTKYNHDDLERRFRGELVYAAGSEQKKRYSLLCLDIDYEKGADQTGYCEQAIRDALGVTFIEQTEGGSHAWIVIDKQNKNGRLTNSKWRNDFRPIKAQIERLTFHGIDKVEVKATLDEWFFDQYDQPNDYCGGTFATIPILDTNEQTEAFINSPVYNLNQLGEAIDRLEYQQEPTTTQTEKKKKRTHGGSTAEFIFTDSDRPTIEEAFFPIADSLLALHGETLQKPSGRDVITTVDLAAMLFCLYQCSVNAYDNGALPVGRIRRCWNALRDAGIIERTFKPNKVKVIRDWLSDLGVIDWQDNSYWFFDSGHTKHGRGRAMKWGLTAEFIAEIDAAIAGLSSDTIGYVVLHGIRYLQIKSILLDAPIIRPDRTIPLDDYRIEETKQRQREDFIKKTLWHTAA
jgi:hypothetical protein